MNGIISDLPKLSLTKAFITPFDNAVATARTCYSSKIIYDADVSKSDAARSLRDKIAQSTYMAGHHTTLQHAHFQFAIENVSRQALWSFFHAHPFYNSEQVSQRYVEVKNGKYLIPELKTQAMTDRFNNVVIRQQNSYNQLIELLYPAASKLYFEVFRGRQKNQDDKRWQSAIKKRCQEVARYVLPLATHAHLYHTISGLTLHRYHRLMQCFDCPTEQKLVIQEMVNAVNQLDPLFFKDIEDPFPLNETMEAEAFIKFSLPEIDSLNAFNNAQDFDAELNGKTAKLINFTPHASELLAKSIRQSLVISQQKMSDTEALSLVLSPKNNRYLGESLNLLSLGKLSRSLDLVHFTFIKKISHSADSQAQRHRMIPGARPIFSRTIQLEEPDYITPELFKHVLAVRAKSLYDQVHEQCFNDIKWLYNEGANAESLQYLFSNAYPIRYIDSASLMDHMHKWTSRLCYNAQEEIWQSTVDEVMDLKKCEPLIGQYLLPPCGLRKMSGHTPICPEGERFCGVPVWKQETHEYQRLL